VAENDSEQVTYDAGTWTFRARLSKTGQLVAANQDAQVIFIVYRTDSSGNVGANQEIGRANLITTISASPATVAISFTTGSPTVVPAGGKIRVDVFVQTHTANIPAAPVAAVSVIFLVDESDANSGSSISSMPGYQIQYVRSQSVTAAASAAMARNVTAFRSAVTTAVGSVARIIALSPIPKVVTAVGVPAIRKSVGLLAKTVSVVGLTTVRKGVALIPKVVTATGTAAMSRRVVASRVFTTAAAGVAGFARALIFGRQFTTTANGAPSGRLDLPMTALNRIIPAAATDWPLNAPTKAIAGVTRNSAGAVVVSATVYLIRQVDGVRVASTTSHATTGAYSFARGTDDPYNYRTLAVKAGSPEIHGVTDLLVPA